MDLQIQVRNPMCEPTRGTSHSAGLDLRADLDGPCRIIKGPPMRIPTGVSMAIPEGHVGIVAIRSSLGAAGLTMSNGIGVIDSDYRGEIQMLLTYIGIDGSFTIDPYDRIGQIIIMPHLAYNLQWVDVLPETQRGTGGFGSTGKA